MSTSADNNYVVSASEGMIWDMNYYGHKLTPIELHISYFFYISHSNRHSRIHYSSQIFSRRSRSPRLSLKSK